MPNYFRNLEETIDNIDSSKTTPSMRLKFWMMAHLRIIWSLVMMLILFFLCLWMSYKAGENSGGTTIIESLGTPVDQKNINDTIENEVRKNIKSKPSVEAPSEEESEEL